MRHGSFLICACVASALVPLRSVQRLSVGPDSFRGWPREFEGAPIRMLTLRNPERGWSERFPGRVGRFTDGRREIIVRWLTRETRQLHPASDCLRAFGYSVQPQPLHVDSARHRWSCFVAVRNGERLRVRERITDDDGQSWSDVSSWFWAATLRQSRGPWWTFTVAERVWSSR